MNASPPKLMPATPPLGWCAGIVLLATGLGVGATVFFFNPATHGFYPVCQFHRLTGLNCPGCGMTRSLYALLHGQWSAALRDNALFVLGLALLLGRGLWLGISRWLGRPAGAWLAVKTFWPFLVVALVFTVLRNLPAFAFLSP